jgi:hypothetical protein
MTKEEFFKSNYFKFLFPVVFVALIIALSIINLESDKVKVLDSLINKSSSRLDSVAKEKLNL